MPRENLAHQPLCVDNDDFSLYAASRVEAMTAGGRSYSAAISITRLALSDRQPQLNAAGHAELKLKTP